MVDIVRPLFGEVWAASGEKLAPESTKIQSGWIQEMMPYQYENFLVNRQDVALTYLLQKGVAEWASDQEYTASKSVVQYLGHLYIATSTVTNVLPTVTASWRKLTVVVGADGTIPISVGGTGASTAAQARTNLGLGDVSVSSFPVANGMLVKQAGGVLASRTITGTAGLIEIVNGDGVSGNPTISVGVNVAKTNADASWSTTGSIKLPSGSTAEQGIATPGRVRFNLETDEFHGAYSSGWQVLAKPATASQTPIVDIGNLYSSDNVEGALQEVVTQQMLAATGGSSLVGYDGGTVQDVLDNAKPMQSYTDLLAYTGRATGVRITTPRISGLFQYDANLPNISDGGTRFAHASGIGAWRRLYLGPIYVAWFEAVGDGIADDTSAFVKAIDTNIKTILAPDVYKVTASLALNTGQVIQGMGRGFSKILWRPVSDIVCIRNKAGTNYNGIRDITLDSNSPAKYACQFSTSYANIVQRCALKGSWDIGVLMHDNYVAQLDDLDTTGTSFRRFIVAISKNSNGHTINKIHTSSFPSDPLIPLIGIAIEGGKGHIIRDPALQGQTIGIYLAAALATQIISPYFENTLCNIKTGDNTKVGNSNSTLITSGHYSSAYNTHPQYASRGPIVYAVRCDQLKLINPVFNETANPASSTGPWPILTSGTTGRIHIDAPFHLGSTARALIVKDLAGASPSVTMTGSSYGTFGAVETILKCDGAFGGKSYGLQIDSAGVITTNEYTPAVITGTVSSLLQQGMPDIASLVV